MSYTLILAEKPSASNRIAYALAEGSVNKLSRYGAPYYKIKRANKDIIVAPAVGHLFILNEKNGREWQYPTFSVHWQPTFIVNKKNYWAKKYYENIKFLAKNASEFISSCDYDVEGSTIAFNILRFICGVKDGKRMKFSTLTKPDLIEAYENASEHLDFPQIEAGLARHTLDFYFGINLSRALILALKQAGGYKTLSTGRVQGPTLKILEERGKEIKKFIPTPYWQLELIGIVNGQKIIALHIKDKFWEKEDAAKVLEKCKGKPACVEKIEKTKYRQFPFPPFDLTTLQREAYANFGFSPQQTLNIAEQLYLQALISYPRTSSQKLPPKIGYKNIISKLTVQKDYSELCKKLLTKPWLKPREGKLIDPAHPAIFPTGNEPKKLTEPLKKIYDLITKRFLSVFADPAIREAVKAIIDVNKEKFIAQGVRTIESNWIEFYKPYARFKEQFLPAMKEGDKVEVEKLELLEKETQPPKRYTQATILKEMESNGLGTKATRAQILQTLYDRDYIKERIIEVTKLGEAVVSALEKYCPEILSVELTRKFEEEMEAIQEGKKRKEETIKESEITLKKILEKFKLNEDKIGKELLGSVKESEEAKTTIGKCECSGNLKIKRSFKTNKRFVACSNYPKCTKTYSLPQKGKLTILTEKCKCGLHLVSVRQYKKRPWKLCVRCGFVSKKIKKA